MENNTHGKRCLFAVGLLACTLWLAADTVLGIPALRQPGLTVRVPDLLGQRFTDGALGVTSPFRASVTYVYDDAPPRTVLSQSPPPGATRKVVPGGEAYPLSLVVSLGRRELRLPDTRGLDARVAKAILSGKGLTVEVSPVTVMDGLSRHTPTHAVLDMSPAPGVVVDGTTRVTLFIAEPPEDHGTLCPDLRGLSFPEAAARLRDAGLSIGGVSLAKSSVDDDFRASPDPSSGKNLLPEHDPASPSEAIDPWLIRIGQATRSDDTGVENVLPTATVKDQDKPAGCYLPRGTAVFLTV